MVIWLAGMAELAGSEAWPRLRYPPKISRKPTITAAGSRPARNMVLIGTRAMIAYMISGTEGASSTPSALALVTSPMPRRSG